MNSSPYFWVGRTSKLPKFAIVSISHIDPDRGPVPAIDSQGQLHVVYFAYGDLVCTPFDSTEELLEFTGLDALPPHNEALWRELKESFQ